MPEQVTPPAPGENSLERLGLLWSRTFFTLFENPTKPSSDPHFTPEDLAALLLKESPTSDIANSLAGSTIAFGTLAPDQIEEVLVRIKGACEMDELKTLSLPVDPRWDLGERTPTATFPEAFTRAFYKKLEDLHTYTSPDIGPSPTKCNVPPAFFAAISIKLGFPTLPKGFQHPHVSLARLGLQLSGVTPPATAMLPIHHSIPREIFAVSPLIMFAMLGAETYARILVDEGEEYQDVVKGVRSLKGEVEHEGCAALLNAVLKEFADGSNQERDVEDVWDILFPNDSL